MTGVTLPIAMNSPKMVRSSWFTFAVKKTGFYPPRFRAGYGQTSHNGQLLPIDILYVHQ
jgi:hypothetical protein